MAFGLPPGSLATGQTGKNCFRMVYFVLAKTEGEHRSTAREAVKVQQTNVLDLLCEQKGHNGLRGNNRH